MPTVTQVNDLKINKLTKAQYDAAVQAGTIGENEISIITDLDAGQIIQVDTLPTASATEEGKIYQYIGVTDQNYTNGYFYKCSEEATYSGTVTFAPGSESGVTLTCSAADFGAFAKRYTNDPTVIVETGFSYGSNGFMFICTDSQEEPIVMEQDIPLLELERSGFSFSGQPVVDDGFLGTCSLTASGSNYLWTQVDVQPTPVIPDPLPSQSGNSGKFLMTDGTDASWADALVNTATETKCLTIAGNVGTGVYNTNVGYESSASGNGASIGFHAIASGGGVACGRYSSSNSYGTAVGNYAEANNSKSIALGLEAKARANNAIQFGQGINSDANTVKIANANGNFELMSADGTIPKERLANVISMPATMPELTVAGWSSNTQTVNVTGVTANNVVFVSPAPLSTTEYAQCGVACIAQAAGTLTFTCTTVPENALTVNVVCL